MNFLTKANGCLPRDEDEQKQMIDEASIHYGNFLNALGFDWQSDPQTIDTPRRVAKAWVHDLIKGSINFPPNISVFPNEEEYDGIVAQTFVDIKSMCAHHNLPFHGHCHIGYLPGEQVIGLSKLNRVANWFARRPQMQESLTQQIHDFLSEVLIGNKGVFVMIEAKHLCCSNRGIGQNSTMVTNKMSGKFLDNDNLVRNEMFELIKASKLNK